MNQSNDTNINTVQNNQAIDTSESPTPNQARGKQFHRRSTPRSTGAKQQLSDAFPAPPPDADPADYRSAPSVIDDKEDDHAAPDASADALTAPDAAETQKTASRERKFRQATRRERPHPTTTISPSEEPIPSSDANETVPKTDTAPREGRKFRQATHRERSKPEPIAPASDITPHPSINLSSDISSEQEDSAFPSNLLADWAVEQHEEQQQNNELTDVPFVPAFPYTENMGAPAVSSSLSQDNTEPIPQDDAKKLRKIATILFTVGIATTVCLVFFFYTLFHVKNSRDIPYIFDAQQLSATDDAVLISWSASESADLYRIYFTDSNGQEVVSDCDLPFAALRNLEPNASYDVDIFALKEGKEYKSQRLTCATKSYCGVKEILIPKIGNDFVKLSWNYEGVNEGFMVIAYVLDADSKRHLTTDPVEVPAGKSECSIKGLTPELQYTVTIMPLTSYRTVGQFTFTTGKYSKKYNDIEIIRLVICPENSKNSSQVHALKQIKSASPYKASLIINGKTNKKHKVNLSLTVTDLDGALVSCQNYPDIYTNPENKQWFIHRSYLFDFTSPKQPGEYYLYLVMDGKYGTKIKFTVQD